MDSNCIAANPSTLVASPDETDHDVSVAWASHGARGRSRWCL